MNERLKEIECGLSLNFADIKKHVESVGKNGFGIIRYNSLDKFYKEMPELHYVSAPDHFAPVKRTPHDQILFYVYISDKIGCLERSIRIKKGSDLPVSCIYQNYEAEFAELTRSHVFFPAGNKKLRKKLEKIKSNILIDIMNNPLYNYASVFGSRFQWRDREFFERRGLKEIAKMFDYFDPEREKIYVVFDQSEVRCVAELVRYYHVDKILDLLHVF